MGRPVETRLPKYVTFRMPESLAEAVARRMDALDQTRSQVIRESMERGLVVLEVERAMYQ